MAKNSNEDLFVTILETGMQIDQCVQKALKEYEITHAQYNVLRILNGSYPEALCTSDIKERMVVPNSDLTRLMDRLEKKEFILRGICTKNRRKVNILISSKGQELLIDSLPGIKAGLNHFFEDEIDKNEASALTNKIQFIKERLKPNETCEA